MTLRRLAECYDGNCPAVDLDTETGDFWVTGYVLAPRDKVGVPATEDRVVVPREVLIAAVAAWHAAAGDRAPNQAA